MSEIGEVNSLETTTGADIDAAKTALGHEIFDAIWNLCAFANAAGIDLDEAARNRWCSTPAAPGECPNGSRRHR